MTISGLEARPPRWAEALLCLVLRPEDRDSVSGDLLEEYREAIVPARGARANRWYVRQVGWFLLQASWKWALAIGATLIVRYLLDMLAPVHYTPGIVHPRSRIMSQMLLAIFASAAFWNTWRSAHLRTGALVALTAGILGGLLSSMAAIVLLGVWHDAPTLEAIRNSGGLDEAIWFVPLLMVPISLISGMAGAIAAKGLCWPLKRHRA